MAEGAGNVQRHKGWRRAAQTGWVAHRGPVGRAHEDGWHIWMWVGMAGGTTGGRTVWVGGMEMVEGVPIGKWVGSTQLQPLSVGHCHPNHSLCTHCRVPTVCHPTYCEVTRR